MAGQITGLVQPAAPGLAIFISGGLGAGKTTWVRGLLTALGHAGKVRSPSFTVMEPYSLKPQGKQDVLQIYHFDFYRFTMSEEWREAGFDELIGSSGSLSLVEWPEMAEQSLAAPDLWMKLEIPAGLTEDLSTRELKLEIYSTVGEKLLGDVLHP